MRVIEEKSKPQIDMDEDKPQMNADERRFVNLDFGKIQSQRHRTRMTRIRRIYTDTVNPYVSVSSVFYRNYTGMSDPLVVVTSSILTGISAFICVYLRLNSNGKYPGVG